MRVLLVAAVLMASVLATGCTDNFEERAAGPTDEVTTTNDETPELAQIDQAATDAQAEPAEDDAISEEEAFETAGGDVIGRRMDAAADAIAARH